MQGLGGRVLWCFFKELKKIGGLIWILETSIRPHDLKRGRGRLADWQVAARLEPGE